MVCLRKTISMCNICSKHSNPNDLRAAENVYILHQELNALQPLCSELFLDIHAMKLSRRRIRLSKTYYGKLLNVLGHVLFVYCVFKTGNAIFNIVLSRDRTIDPITKFFIRLCYLTNVQLDQLTIEFYTQHLSFLMIGMFTNIYKYVYKDARCGNAKKRRETSHTCKTIFCSYHNY